MIQVQQYDNIRFDVYQDGGFMGSVSISQKDGLCFEKGMIDYLTKEDVMKVSAEVFLQWVLAGCH
jgi:hypothetical protein